MIKINRNFITILLISILPFAANAFQSSADYAVLMDHESGKILYSRHAETQMAPSSMSKLMTLYVAFKALQSGELKLTDEALISEKAWKMEGSKMFLEVGKKVSVNDLLKGIIVQSGNDACVALAEHMAGDEASFVEKMNAEAQNLKLTASHFANVTGLPNNDHYMTAQDLAILGRALVKDFGEYYSLFGEKEFEFNNITQPNRNYLLGEDGIDGMKTGHTDAGGFGIVASAQREGKRLIAVVNGLDSENARLEEVKKLLTFGFTNFTNLDIAKANKPLDYVPVWHGSHSKVAAVAKEDIFFILPKTADVANMKVSMRRSSLLDAPIKEGEHIQDMIISIPGYKEELIVPLYAEHEVRPATLFGKLYDNLRARLSSIGK